jgi:hypothetical protein
VPEAADFLLPEDVGLAFLAVFEVRFVCVADFFADVADDLRTWPLERDAVFFAAVALVLLAAFAFRVAVDFAFGFWGTLAPLSLASDKPIATACLREVTFFPLRPIFNLPCFISCIASFTFSPAFLEYFAIVIEI